MARSRKLKDLEKKHQNLEKVIVTLVNKGGQAEAARELNVTQATISNFLKRRNYRPVTIYRKEGE